MGKNKPIWDPSTDCGDYVVATGCAELHTTGKKKFQKQYYSHTTRPGSLKQMSMEQMMAKWGGGEVLKRAVRGMLPKNRLRDKRMARLKGTETLNSCLRPSYVVSGVLTVHSLVFEGLAHPYKKNIIQFSKESTEQQPQVAKALEQVQPSETS